MTVGDVIWFLEIRDVVLRDVIPQNYMFTFMFQRAPSIIVFQDSFFHPGALLFVHGDVSSVGRPSIYMLSRSYLKYLCAEG